MRSLQSRRQSEREKAPNELKGFSPVECNYKGLKTGDIKQEPGVTKNTDDLLIIHKDVFILDIVPL